MQIKEILNEFVETCSKKLELEGILQFGSSTHSKDFKDIDLVFYSQEQIICTKSLLKLVNIFKDFEKKYLDVIFDFGGDRKKKSKYSITVIFMGKRN